MQTVASRIAVEKTDANSIEREAKRQRGGCQPAAEKYKISSEEMLLTSKASCKAMSEAECIKRQQKQTNHYYLDFCKDNNQRGYKRNIARQCAKCQTNLIQSRMYEKKAERKENEGEAKQLLT